jgi:hypothetical protein
VSGSLPAVTAGGAPAADELAVPRGTDFYISADAAPGPV